MASTTEKCALGHASPVQECPKCNPLSEASTPYGGLASPTEAIKARAFAVLKDQLEPRPGDMPLAGPTQLPAPAAPTVPLSVQDLDDFVKNLQDRRVKRLAFTGNIKGAAVVLEIQFEPPPRRQDDGGFE